MAINLDNILVLDIETVRACDKYEDLPERLQEQWDRKAVFLTRDTEQSSKEAFEDRGGIYAEFGKVIAISAGFFTRSGNEWHLRVRGLKSKDESELLEEFNHLMAKFDQTSLVLCAHNGKEFDFPYLCRRLLVNSLPIPASIDATGKKPWEVNHLDTMELWKFGDRKSYTSLELLATIFDKPSSKSAIDGSMVGQVYYEQGDLELISEYCNQDVVVTAQLLLKLNQLSLIDEDNIHIVEA